MIIFDIACEDFFLHQEKLSLKIGFFLIYTNRAYLQN